MSSIIKLGEKPKTFARVIEIKDVDGTEYKLPVICKYRTRSEYVAWIEQRANAVLEASETKPKAAKGKTSDVLTQDHARGAARQIDELLDMLDGWGLEGHEMNRENLSLMADQWPQVVPLLLSEYRDACMFGKSGN